jgi:hypothetical protein
MFQVMIVVGILANLGAIIVFASEKGHVASIDSWATYSSKEGGYSISYPKGWQLNEPGGHGIISLVKFSDGEDAEISASTEDKTGPLAGFMRPGPSLNKQSPLKESHDQGVELVSKISPSFNPSETATTVIAGREAFCTSFDCVKTTGLMSRRMKGMILSAWNGDSMITFNFECPTGEYESLLPAFKNMLKTYTPSQQTQQPQQPSVGDPSTPVMPNR